jgi:TetR/AcrR family transcriptional regulator, regulator of autoinduction and epiphytic fitness
MTVVDGRTQRGARNREAIIDALIACYDDGELRPSVQQVADRAGVSARSVHNHFVDVEALCAEVSQRQWERFSHLAVVIDVACPIAERVEQLVTQRAEIFEGVTPVRRAALLMAPDSPTIVANLARLDRTLRHQIERALPGITPDVLDAVDALASWDTWNRLRGAQGLAMPRAQRVLTNAICTLLEDLADEGDA